MIFLDSLFGWIGGKKLLRQRICNEFPENFKTYVEVFGGAGWVLFHKERHAHTEVYNDLNSNLVNLFRCVKHHSQAVEDEISYTLNAREIFECFKQQSESGLTDIQRAARFLYLIRASYGSNTRQYGAKPRKMKRAEQIGNISQRLEQVVIENKSYDKLIMAYDKETTLFYCDPPYYKTEDMYDTGGFIFDESKHRNLRDIIGQCKGKAIVSYNDCDFIRSLYKGFHIIEIERQNNLANRYKVDARYRELIIKNF